MVLLEQDPLQEMAPPLGAFSCHSLRLPQMPDALAAGAGCLVHYLYRSADLNFGIQGLCDIGRQADTTVRSGITW
jgi:hypothetical protein